MEGKDFIGALMTVPEGETARQYRLTKQMASMHAALRDRYRRLEVLSGSALIVVSVLFTVTAFSGGELFSLFDLSVQQGRSVLAGGSVVAFTFSLIVLLFDWPGKKARHGEACRRWAGLASEYRTRRDQEKGWDAVSRNQLAALYREVGSSTPAIPEDLFARLKARHLRKVALSRIREEYLWTPEWILRLRFIRQELNTGAQKRST